MKIQDTIEVHDEVVAEVMTELVDDYYPGVKMLEVNDWPLLLGAANGAVTLGLVVVGLFVGF